MADSTIQGLTSIEEIVDNDLMLMWDNSAVTDNTKKVTTLELIKYIADKLSEPVGTILSYGGLIAPDGYLVCDGSAISRMDYIELFNAIGIAYGEGDGSTTFNLPDLRESTIVGIGQNTTNTISSHDVYALGEFKDDQLQGHKHTTSGPSSTTLMLANGTYYGIKQPDMANGGSPTNDGTNGTPRTGTTTHGKQTGINFIIKYKKY